MTEIGVALCVITIIFCLYAIIISRKHTLLTFLLVPLFVFTSFYMYYITNLYKGMPLYDIPTGENVTLVSLKMGKPWIYLVIRLDGEEMAKLYAAPYTEENKEQMQQVGASLKRAGDTNLRGQFIQNARAEYQWKMQTADTGPKEIKKPVPSTHQGF